MTAKTLQVAVIALTCVALSNAARAQVVINECFTGAPDWCEIANLGGAPVDISGWTLHMADDPSVIESMDVGGQPWHPVFTRDGREVWIPNQAANTVTVIDVATWTIAEVIEHPALVEPHGSAVSPDGRTIYSADEGELNYTGGRGWSA